MARIRSIKPEFFRHELLNQLEDEHPGLRIMTVFSGLWCQCDKQGVFPYKPKSLRLDILPFVEYDISETLNILEKNGFIERFDSEGKNYAFIPTFHTHQRISGEECKQAPKYPEPPRKQEGSTGEAGEKHEGTLAEKQTFDKEQEGSRKEDPSSPGKGVGIRDKGEGVQDTPLLLTSWYRSHQSHTGRLIRPSEADRAESVKAMAQLAGDEVLARQCVDYYWANWQKLYFAIKKGTKDPDWNFRSFARNITSCIPPSKPEAPKPEGKKSCPNCGSTNGLYGQGCFDCGYDYQMPPEEWRKEHLDTFSDDEGFADEAEQ